MLLQILEAIGLHGYSCYLHVALQSLTPLFKICHAFTFCLAYFYYKYWFSDIIS